MAHFNIFKKRIAPFIGLSLLLTFLTFKRLMQWPDEVWPLATRSVDAPGFCSVTVNLEDCSCTRIVQSHLPLGCPGPLSTSSDILEWIKLVYGESTCNDLATIRGPGQKVISYSIYGGFPNEYYNGFEHIVPQISKAYPGWNLRFYFRLDMQNIINRNWLCDLACKYPHLDLCHIERLPVLGDISKSIGRVWRFSPMGDPLVDRFAIRDADSSIIQREVDAVQDWIKDGSCFHVMRDHPLHKKIMLAGMWGGCNTWRHDLLSVTRKILNRAHVPQKQTQDDQRALADILWNVAVRNMTVHDSYFCKKYGSSKPFPTKRVNLTYIGAKNYISNPKYSFPIQKECPHECRPQDHKDWNYC
ncbi:uncharacterized protein [Palaemon carinicauda]|uniref:uncharacterized protein n=1 Tax=Palaemon carinicauda TaxID=392227 RepID=UPI0035B68E5B